MAITLEGADKVTTDLAKIGPAADKAFKQIQTAAEKAGVGVDKRLGIALAAMRTRLAAVEAAGRRLGQSFTTFTLSVTTFGNAVANSAKKIGLITAAISGAIGAVVLFGKSSAANSERIDNQAKSLGLSVEAYQNFETAAKNAGLEQGAFDQILQRFVVNAAESGDAAGEAAKQTTDLAKSMRQVEVTLEDGSKKFVTVRGTSENFAKSLKTVGDSAKGGEKDLIAFAKKVTALKTVQEQLNAVLAAGASKRAAAATITFLRAIANDADDAARALSKTVGPLTQLEIGVGVQLDNAFDRLGTNLQRTKDRLFTLFSPVLLEAVNRFADVIFENQEALRAWADEISQKAIVIVRDLINLLSGNDDLVETKWLLDFRDGIVSLGVVIKETAIVIKDAFLAIHETIDGFVKEFNRIFGTELKTGVVEAGFAILALTGGFKLLGATIAVFLASAQLVVSALGLIASAFGLTGTSLGLVILSFGLVEVSLDSLQAKIDTMVSTPFPVGDWIVASLTATTPIAAQFWGDFTNQALEASIKVREFFNSDTFKGWIEDLKKDFSLLWGVIEKGASAAFEAFKSIARSALEAIGTFVSNLIEKVRDLIAAIRAAVAARSSSSSDDAEGRAQGGPVRGPGTGTSDSIPAWLSHGEFVIRAAAVRKWGSGLFHALNGLRMPRKGLQLNMGGMAHAMAPRYATGGPVATPAPSGGGRPVTVNFGGESFEMSASDTVVERLMRAATGKKIRSNGRKPAWYGA